MPFSISINKKSFLSLWKGTGEITPEDIKLGFDSLLTQPDFIKRIPSICDLRFADLSKLNWDEISKIIKYISEIYEVIDKTKVAVIVKGKLQYGLLKIFQTYVDKEVMQVKIFTDYEEAKTWLIGTDFKGVVCAARSSL